jgi:hypothetical protein
LECISIAQKDFVRPGDGRCTWTPLHFSLDFLREEPYI